MKTCILALLFALLPWQPTGATTTGRIVTGDERTELYLPVGRVELGVKVGDKVRGGSSVVATLTE